MSGKPAHESDTSPVADDATQDDTQDETVQAQQESQAPTSEGPGTVSYTHLTLPTNREV